MPLQDLTPQLRTRLNQKERAVGWFVFLATLLLLGGFGYYLFNTAQSKGWFLVKARFYTYVNSAADLSVGDPVYLMGFKVGEVTGFVAMPPRTPHNVRIDFTISQINQTGGTNVPYYSYVLSQGSMVKLNSSGILGKRGLEITRGIRGFGLYTTHSPERLSLEQVKNLPDPDKWRMAENLLDEKSNILVSAFTSLTNLEDIVEAGPESLLAFHFVGKSRRIGSMWDKARQRYQAYDSRNLDPTNACELPAQEAPALGDQLQAMVAQVQQALPNVLALTNKLAAVLDNATYATSNLNATIVGVRPLVTNFTAISGDLRGPGALGAWVLGTNASLQLAGALTNANVLLTNASVLLVNVDTNLDALTEQIGMTLINLADITSNLNVQVQSNSNLLGGFSKTIQDTDGFIQGLKHHWLLRSAFKTKATNQPAFQSPPPPKAK